jgi:molybdate transport system substrate-binding protein
MDAKLLKQTGPAGVPQTVARGEAELGLFLANVLIAPGVELAGPFPGDLQYELAFTASLSTTTKEPAAAQEFISFLQSPAAQAMFTARGLKAG